MKKGRILFLASCFFALSGPLWAADQVAVEIHYQSGIKYFKRGLYDKAIEEFGKTLELDPQQTDAREYLEKVRALQKTYRPAEARESADAEIRTLYDEGRRLYRAKRYEEAIEVFNKILVLKPIDDFASYYREKSEVLLSRQRERARKLEEGRRSGEGEGPAAAAPAPVAKAPQVHEEAAAPGGGREERLSRAELRRQEKIRLQEDKRAEAQRRREARLRLREEKRQEKATRRQAVRARGDRQAAEHEQQQAAALDKRAARDALVGQRREIKEHFLEGVSAYGRKNYQEAITIFRDVVKAEQRTGALYTSSARRLIDKARKKMEE
ncbi:MAG: hypothetical protein ACM3L6_04130 [Deltaproteobacteria bacterium]